MRLATLSLLLACATPLAFANDVYVDVLHGDNITGNGTAAAPFATITKALSVVAQGDSVHVAPGVYSPSSGETFPLVLPNGVELLGSGIHQCVLTGEGDGTLLDLNDGNLVSDFQLERAQVAVTSLLFHLDLNYLRRCRFENNTVAIEFTDWLHSDSRFVMVNCSLTENGVAIRHESSGLDFNSVTLLIYGSTIAGNGDAIELAFFGERYLGLYNSVVQGNGDDSLEGFYDDVGVSGNLISDPAFLGANGNEDLAPGILDPLDGDPHLSAIAAARDFSTQAPAWPPIGYWTGSSNWLWESDYRFIDDIDGQERAVGSAGDAGCDEFRAPTLHLNRASKVAGTLEMRLQGEPGDVLISFAGFDLFPSPVSGLLWIQAPYVIFGNTVLPSSGAAQIIAPVPANPALLGVDVYLQAVRVAAAIEGSGPAWARLLP